MNNEEAMGESESGGEKLSIFKPNFNVIMGEIESHVVFYFTVRRTLIMRLKWWLFCKIFPFRYGWIE